MYKTIPQLRRGESAAVRPMVMMRAYGLSELGVRHANLVPQQLAPAIRAERAAQAAAGCRALFRCDKKDKRNATALAHGRRNATALAHHGRGRPRTVRAVDADRKSSELSRAPSLRSKGLLPGNISKLALRAPKRPVHT
eukprot:2034235-Prymnesium_polylepis.1